MKKLYQRTVLDTLYPKYIFWQFPISGPTIITLGPWLMKLDHTPSPILTLVTWVQRTQAWPSANSTTRLAFGQTESYSLQPCLPLAATRVFFLLNPARILDGRAQLYSSELSYSAVVITFYLISFFYMMKYFVPKKKKKMQLGLLETLI